MTKNTLTCTCILNEATTLNSLCECCQQNYCNWLDSLDAAADQAAYEARQKQFNEHGEAA